MMEILQNKWLWIGGTTVVGGYFILRSIGSGSSQPASDNSLTYVGPGVPAVTTQGNTVADYGNLTDSILASGSLQTDALDKQFQLAKSNQIIGGILDMYATVAPSVNVQRGFTQDWGANIDYTSTGASVRFTGGITPVAPQQDLLDQITYLTSEKTDNTNKINALKLDNADLKSQVDTTKSGDSLAAKQVTDLRTQNLSLQAQLAKYRDAVFQALSRLNANDRKGGIAQLDKVA